MKLIVGLGNPGTEYKNTRHNIGFLAAENIAARNGIAFKEGLLNAQLTSGFFFDENILIAKPLTYMNLTGTAVFDITEYHNLQPKDIIVIHDDMDIDFLL